MKNIRVIFCAMTFCFLIISCGKKNKEAPKPVDISTEILGVYEGSRTYSVFGTDLLDKTVKIRVTESFKDNTVKFSETNINSPKKSIVYEVQIKEPKSNGAKLFIPEQNLQGDILKGMPISKKDSLQGVYVLKSTSTNTDTTDINQTLTFNLRVLKGSNVNLAKDYKYFMKKKE